MEAQLGCATVTAPVKISGFKAAQGEQGSVRCPANRRSVVTEYAKAIMLRLHLIKHEDGFTLNEVLVSIALIAIGVLGLSFNTIGVIQGNQISGNITTATNLAQDKLEELRAQTSFTNGDNCPSPADPITGTGAAGGIYNRCWRITDSSLGPGLKQIDVTVSWRDYVNRSVTLSTLVFTG